MYIKYEGSSSVGWLCVGVCVMKYKVYRTKQWPVNKSKSIRCGSQYSKVKVHQSHYRPEVPRGFRKLRFPDYVTVAEDGTSCFLPP